MARVVFLLLVLFAVAVGVKPLGDFESVVYVNRDVVLADSPFDWFPTEEMRSSWVQGEVENGKWSFPVFPVSQVSGSVYSIVDGDVNSGFVWKTVSLEEKCLPDSVNCIEDGSLAL